MANNKFRLTIGFKLLSLIMIIITIVIVSNVVMLRRFNKELKNQRKNITLYHPSIELINKLDRVNIKSLSLIKTWVFIDKKPNTAQKQELIDLFEVEYPKIMDEIANYQKSWDFDKQNMYLTILNSMDSLKNSQYQIMDKLAFFENYQNPQIMFGVIPLISDNGELIRKSKHISDLSNSLANELQEELYSSTTLLDAKFLQIRNNIFLVTIVIILIVIILSIDILRNTYDTKAILSIIKEISIGKLPKIKELKRNNELGELHQNVQKMIDQLKNISDFATDIGENKFDTNFKPAGKDDVLGNALVKMRENLLKAQKDADLRQLENMQRNWASQGIATFNELIRDNSNNLEELTKAVIEKLVNYTEANIGGLFVVNEDDKNDKYLELKAFYAFDRHKFKQKIIKPGETLVGQCYIENDTIFISDVPENYISIASGLGSDKPKNILIIPLQFNEITYGVVELASFNIFEEYKIDFVEKISETIASAISSAKVNTRTAKLLEESNEKSKRLEQQEIEAREKISKVKEQLTSLQDKYRVSLESNDLLDDEKYELIEKLTEVENQFAEKIEEEKEKFTDLQTAINSTMPYYEINTNGDIIYANQQYINLLKLPQDEVFNHRHINFINRDFINTGNYKQIWDKLKVFENVNTSIQYMIDGKNKYITENLIPVVHNNSLVKVIVFCTA